MWDFKKYYDPFGRDSLIAITIRVIETMYKLFIRGSKAGLKAYQKESKKRNKNNNKNKNRNKNKCYSKL